MSSSKLDWFIPEYFYEPKEGTQQLSVDAPFSIAILGIFQSLGVGGLFCYFVWMFSNETIESVKISSEVLPHPYRCKVLSPYSGQEIFDYDTSENAILSRSLVVYDECMTMLAEADVCHQNMTVSNVMSVFGYEVYDQSHGSTQDCIDVPLNYMRFCKGTPFIGSVDEIASLAFPTTSSFPTYSETYFAVIDTDHNTLLTETLSNSSTVHSKLFYFNDLLDYDLDLDTWSSNEKNMIWVAGDTVIPPGSPPGVVSSQVLLEINILNASVKEILSTKCCQTTLYVGYDVDTINDVGYVMFKQSGGLVDIRVIDSFSSVENYNVSYVPSSPSVTCPDVTPDAVPVRPITVALSDTTDASDNVMYVGCGTSVVSVVTAAAAGEPPSPPQEYTYFYVRGVHISTNVQTEYEISLDNITDTTAMGDRVTYLNIAYIYQIFTVSRSSAPAELYMTGTTDASIPNPTYYLLYVDLNTADKKVRTLSIVQNKFLHRIFSSFSGGVGPPTVNPTHAPSGAPTSGPSPLPTAAPSPSPTATPTVNPTPQPSPTPGTPTAMPSVRPTIVPTFVPTAVPTVTPTVAPSATPTVNPTPQPSPTPGTPTAMPSIRPTAVPTAVPTAPTSMPTTAMQTQVVVAVVTPLTGITATAFLSDTTNSDAFQQTTAVAIGNGVSSSDITILNVTNTVVRRLNGGRSLTTSGVNIDWSFVYIAEQVNNSVSATADSTASSLTALVSTAITDGSFASTMGRLSTALSAVTVAASTYSAPVATVLRTAHPSVSPTSSPPTLLQTPTPSQIPTTPAPSASSSGNQRKLYFVL